MHPFLSSFDASACVSVDGGYWWRRVFCVGVFVFDPPSLSLDRKLHGPPLPTPSPSTHTHSLTHSHIQAPAVDNSGLGWLVAILGGGAPEPEHTSAPADDAGERRCQGACVSVCVGA